MRKLLLGTALSLIAASVAAQDVALVLGTERYQDIDRLNRGDEPVDTIDDLRDAGFSVLGVANGTASQVDRALDGFAQRVPQAERIVVALSGRFITDGERAWYLTADADRPEYLGLDETAVSVDSIMRVMSRSPGSAILLIGYDNRETDVYDAWISEGLGTLDIPQGVTVLYGGPRAIARFMSRELVAPGEDLARLVAANRDIRAAGYLPRSMVFSPDVRRNGGQVTIDPPIRNDAAERAMWSGAQALDTIDAYRNYLDRYPRGQFVEEARAAIEVIRGEPNRQARLREEAMQLSRSQRQNIQRDLNTLNYNTRGVDGLFGPGTRNAITNWQQQNGLAQTGYLNPEQINLLSGQAQRRAQEIAEQEAARDLEARRAENAFWEQTGAIGTIAGLRAYLDRYPSGRYADIANQRIQEAENASTTRAREEEVTIWNAARSTNTLLSYQSYLNRYPEGRFAEEARVQINALQNGGQPQVAEDGMVRGIEQRFQEIENSLGLNNLTARLVETHLQSLGMNPGPADGTFDEQTRQAIRRYQNERGLQVTGYLDARTAAMMLSEAQ